MIGFSLEPAVSEEQFLRRELDLTWTTVGTEELAEVVAQRHATGKRTAIICSEPDPYLSVLARVPADSVVLVLVSDEGYSAARVRLAQLAAVHSVYRQYPARPASMAQIARAVAGFAGDARGTSQAGRTALPNWQKGRATRTRMRAWQRVSVPVHDVPLGYTHAFVDAFVKTYVPDADASTSLFDVPTPQTQRDISVTFRGNRGLAARIVGMERAARIPASDIEMIDADWSGFATGDVGTTYVDALSRARFALCPPGFVNNESFRFFEALLCGALPVELEVALTHQGLNAPRDRIAIRAYSWRDGLAQAQAMTERERVTRVGAARTLVQRTLSGLRAHLASDVEG